LCHKSLYILRILKFVYKLSIDDTDVPWVPSVKYLGFTLDKGLTWKDHMIALRNKTRQAMSRLFPLIGRKSVMNLRTKLRLIQAVARSQLTYGCAVWGYAAKTHVKRLATTENKLIRAAANAPWFIKNIDLQRDLQWEPFKDYVRRISEATFRRAEHHPNEELRNLVAYDPDYEAGRRRHIHGRPKFQLREAEQ